MSRFAFLAAVVTTLLALLLASPGSVSSGSFLAGDANCDEQVNSIDAWTVFRYAAGYDVGQACLGNAMVDADTEVTVLDGVLVLQYHAGLLGQLPPVLAYAGRVFVGQGVEGDCLAMETDRGSFQLMAAVQDGGLPPPGTQAVVVGYVRHDFFSLCGASSVLIVKTWVVP
jgi:hypothetical protein